MKRVVDIIVVSIAVLWVWSGMVKLLTPHAFRQTLDEHGLIPPGTTNAVAAGVPLLEVALGIGLGWVFGGALPTMRLLMFSLGLICLMTVYLVLVPPEVIAESGCGCQGGVSAALTERGGINTRTAAIGFNTILFTVHTIALVALRFRMRRQATHCPA